jgi:hypothetical protein
MARAAAIWGAISAVFGRWYGRGESVCVQCVNRGSLAFAKMEADLSKVLKADNGALQWFRIVTRSNVSAAMRGKIKRM